MSDQNKFRELSKEYSQLEEVVLSFNRYLQIIDDLKTAEAMLKDPDPDMREMAEEDYKETKKLVEPCEIELQKLLTIITRPLCADIK